jgi:hypothetical protein
MIKLDNQQPQDGRINPRKRASSLDCFNFHGLSMSDGEPVRDLNDLLKIRTDSYRRNARAIQ